MALNHATPAAGCPGKSAVVAPATAEPLRVTYLQRRPRPKRDFSVERLFHCVREALEPSILPAVHVARHWSNGLLPRVRIMLDARKAPAADVYHLTGDIYFASLLLPREKTVITYLDCSFLNTPPGLRRTIRKGLWLTLPARSVTYLTAISQASKDELLLHVTLPPERVIVIPVPVSSAFRPTPRAFNRQKPRLLQIGTAANKNVERLIAALDGLPCVLDLVGELSDEQRALLLQHGIEHEVSCNLTDEALVKKYEDCDLVTFVSTYEGFGMPIVEANAVERAVLTGNVASLPEVAGDAAHLVDPFDVAAIRAGVQRLIEDETYREQLIARGRQNRKRFAPEVIARQYADLYRTVVAEARARRKRFAPEVIARQYADLYRTVVAEARARRKPKN